MPLKAIKTEPVEESAAVPSGLERPKSLLIPATDLTKRNPLAMSLDSPETPRFLFLFFSVRYHCAIKQNVVT